MLGGPSGGSETFWASWFTLHSWLVNNYRDIYRPNIVNYDLI